MDQITVTQHELRAALLAWEEAHRRGDTRTYQETCRLPAAQVVDESSAYLWTLLTAAKATKVPA